MRRRGTYGRRPFSSWPGGLVTPAGRDGMKKAKEEGRPGLTGRTRAVLFSFPAARVEGLRAGTAVDHGPVIGTTFEVT
jgi:hypothetical protein